MWGQEEMRSKFFWDVEDKQSKDALSSLQWARRLKQKDEKAQQPHRLASRSCRWLRVEEGRAGL